MGLFAGMSGTGRTGRGDEKRQMAIDAFEKIRQVKTPTIEEQRVMLKDLVLQGVITPEDAETMIQAPSEMKTLNADQTSLDAQRNALAQLQEIGSEGGMTAIDKARTAEIMSELNADAKGRTEAVMQNARERGLGGSGLELTQRLSEEQGAANRANSAGVQAAADAQQRALQAIQASANLGGTMANEDWQRKSSVAQAQDAINQFNTANKQSVQNNNVAMKNAAQIDNLAAKQGISDANITNYNTNALRESDLIQKKFNNDFNKESTIANGEAGIYNNWGQVKDQSDREIAAEERKGISQSAGAAAKIIAKIASDKNCKEDIKDANVDIEDFMKNLKPYTYRYKKSPEDQHIGVMAQDVEKSDAGKLVVSEGKEGKEIDIPDALTALLASTGNLNDRISKLEGKRG